jgi:hypothetical protein
MKPTQVWIGRLGILLVLCPAVWCAELSGTTLAAFEDYMRRTEQQLAPRLSDPASPLWGEQSSELFARIKGGEIPVEALNGGRPVDVPDGLVHDWIGGAFLPGVRLQDAVALLKDYNRHAQVYQPEVLASKLLSRDGDHFRSYLRLKKKKVLTVVLNTEYDIRWMSIGPRRAACRSLSTKIAEVEHAGTSEEREKALGEGHGFLWRFNAYWWVTERDGGVYVECRAISLTRDVPRAVAWLINPIVSGLPRESLVNALQHTREALPAGSRTH